MKTSVEQTLVRSVRDISIVYSVGEMLINTLDHLISVPNYLKLRRSNYSGSTTILMSKVCYKYGGVTFIEHKYFLIITADAPKRRKLYCTL